LPLVAAGFAITATSSVVFAGSLEAPSTSLLAESAAWVGLVTGMALVLALGVSSVLGSRGTTIGIVLGWQIVAAPLLVEFGALGSFRSGLLEAATDRLEPAALFDGGVAVPMSLSTAVLVVVAWAAVPLAVGAWRTCTRDA